MNEQRQTFVDWLAQRLHSMGTRYLFGVPGGGCSLDLIDATARHKIELVLTAREDAAVIMAGVYGLLASAPGLALCTKGPGLASAANGIASASLDRMSVLLVAETFGPGELNYLSHQVYDQSALVRPLLQNGQYDILAPDYEELDAWLSGLSGPTRQPAVMFPTADAFRSLNNKKVKSSVNISTIELIETKELGVTCEMINTSANPVVILGLEAATATLAPEVRKFVETLKAPVLSTYMAAGTIPASHPNYAGIFTGGAIEQRCVNEADLIILIGLDPVELIRKPWAYKAPVIDLCETKHVPHYLVPNVQLCASLESSLNILTAKLDPFSSKSSWTNDKIKDHREGFYKGLEISLESGLSSTDVVKIAATIFEGKPRLSVDAGAHMFSACAFWPSQEPHDILISNGLATMGFAFPAALAAALYDPIRGSLAMTGDGGLLMCLGELNTAAKMKANICIIVFNDGCLSLIDIKREERQMPDLGLSWDRPDFAAVAKGFGFKSWKAESIDEFTMACVKAKKQFGPCLIDVKIDPSGYLEQMKSLRG